MGLCLCGVPFLSSFRPTLLCSPFSIVFLCLFGCLWSVALLFFLSSDRLRSSLLPFPAPDQFLVLSAISFFLFHVCLCFVLPSWFVFVQIESAPSPENDLASKIGLVIKVRMDEWMEDGDR